jgi:hypothetical protein
VNDVGIGDIFHIIHVSETLEPLDAFYDDVFGPRRGGPEELTADQASVSCF